jgi:hypothetical protein
VFTIITEIPPVYFLYDSPRLSVAFLFFIFAVSVWNGGRFYVEVFGRKFEKGGRFTFVQLGERSLTYTIRARSFAQRAGGNDRQPSGHSIGRTQEHASGWISIELRR